jgi:glycosyltransferase involved in cell wall biosynthesis
LADPTTLAAASETIASDKSTGEGIVKRQEQGQTQKQNKPMQQKVVKKIKIAYVLGSLRDGGAERHALQIIQHLDRDKFEPSLVLMEGVNLERSDSWMAERFVMGIPQGGNTRWIGRSYSFARAVLETASRLKTWDSDIVHAVLPGPSILGGIAARLAGVPVLVGSRHSLVGLYRARGGAAALADRLAFHLADVSVGPSAAVTDEMVRIGGCPRKKCSTLYNGVDTSRFRPGLSRSWRASMGWTNEHVVFGMIANFRACKGHSDFVAAAALIAATYPEARFVMAGADQGLMAATVQQVNEYGLTEKARVLDVEPSPEKIFAALDVYLCTSKSEAFGISLAEAMACGVPVIATAVGGIPEVVDDNETGFLVPVGSPEATAEAAAKLFHRELREVMGMRGRRRLENNFSLSATVRAHEELYAQLLDRARDRIFQNDVRTTF